jgi:hypothetical protein
LIPCREFDGFLDLYEKILFFLNVRELSYTRKSSFCLLGCPVEARKLKLRKDEGVSNRASVTKIKGSLKSLKAHICIHSFICVGVIWSEI